MSRQSYQRDDLESLVKSHGKEDDFDGESTLIFSKLSTIFIAVLIFLGITLFVTLSTNHQLTNVLEKYHSKFMNEKRMSTSYSIAVTVQTADYGSLSSLSYLPWDAVAEPHRENIFSVSSFLVDGVDLTAYLNDSSKYLIAWTISGDTFTGQSAVHNGGVVGVCNATVTISDMSSSDKLFLNGASRFSTKFKMWHKATDSFDKYSSAYELTFLLAVKYVRRELRSLTDSDKSKVLSSMALLYNLSSAEGQKLYGSKYQSAEYFSAKHLYGGARTDCDYWHDGAAVAVTHLAFTLEYEQSLQSIDPSIALPYWEYASDKYLYSETLESVVFDSDWFGAMVGGGDYYNLNDESQWSTVYTASGDNYLDWSIADTGSLNPYVNAYNQLRSPWNNNPSKHISRSNTTYGNSVWSNFPSCDSYQLTIQTSDLSDMNSYLNGKTHGPVHIMIGGAWDTISTSTYSFMDTPNRILFFKILWRQGMTRCPSSCTSVDSCRCSVPDDYVEEYGAFFILHNANVITVLQALGTLGPADSYDDKYWEGLLDVLEHPGVAGDLYSSNAAFDPLFWPIHGTMDRLLALKRIIYEEGLVNFTETWGFPSTNSSGDTFLLGQCDWSNVTSLEDLTLPTCDKSADCPGHVETYVSLFSDFLGEGETYTNGELYDFFHPWTDDLPYTYDDFTFSVCSDNGEDVLSGITDSETLVYSGNAMVERNRFSKNHRIG